MNSVINSIELMDANGTTYSESVDNFRNLRNPNVTNHTESPVTGLPKYDIPITDDELTLRLKSKNYTERFMPRVIKLAVLTCLNATRNLHLHKNTAVIGVTLQAPLEVSCKIYNSFSSGDKAIRPRLGATNLSSSICTSVSRALNLEGPSFMINQSCSAFLTALDSADMLLNTGRTDMVIVFGVDCASHPVSSYIFNSMGIYSKDKVRPFDKNRDGLALGEASVCYVITREDNAQHRLAVINKISVYNDYYNLTSPDPTGIACKTILSSLTDNFTDKIDSINCHATATVVGDDIEISALESMPYVSNIYGLKGSLGHTMSSSAGVEMAYSINGLNNGWIPYTSNLENSIHTKHNIVSGTVMEKEQENFIKLSFGFGGSSAGARIEKWKD